jgi:hypothetical protein
VADNEYRRAHPHAAKAGKKEVVEADLVTYEEALQHCTSAADFERAARGVDTSHCETLSTVDER